MPETTTTTAAGLPARGALPPAAERLVAATRARLARYALVRRPERETPEQQKARLAADAWHEAKPLARALGLPHGGVVELLTIGQEEVDAARERLAAERKARAEALRDAQRGQRDAADRVRRAKG